MEELRLCASIEKLKNKPISWVRRDAGINNRIPFSIEALARHFGFVIKELDFKALGETRYKGLLCLNVDEPDNKNARANDVPYGATIVVDKNLPIEIKRFLVAHEIGHVATNGDEYLKRLKGDDYPVYVFECYSGDDAEHVEKLADKFARELLLPKRHVKSALRISWTKSLTYIANLFQVHAHVLKRRFDDLGLIGGEDYVDDLGRADDYLKVLLQ